MNEAVVVDIISQALVLIIKLALPLLLVSLIIGLIISILQTVTSIQETTLTFVPKLIAIFIVLMILGSWMVSEIREYTVELVGKFSEYISQ